LDIIQGFLVGPWRSALLLSAILTETLHVFTEITVAEEAYPLASPSSSDHWKRLFNGSGYITPVEEDGYPEL